jgi:hypothetical protein
MKKTLAALALTVCGTVGISLPAHSVFLTHYHDPLSFNGAVGGPLLLQDFEGFAVGANLSGVPLLPGVSATTNMNSLVVFPGASNEMFGIGGRDAGTALYNIALGIPRTVIAFDITSFEADPNNASKAQGPGQLVVFFADATNMVINVDGNPLGDPIFVGLVADTAMTSIEWHEAVEGNGGNEETALDNFLVLEAPEPTSLALVGLGLLGLAWRRRRQ